MHRLTVVLPVLNGEQFITESVKSTLRALPKHSEIVVVDDASTDRTVEFIERLIMRDSRVRLIRSTLMRPSGVAASLMRGVENSDSRYIARMDADDICFPWRFHVQLSHLRAVDYAFGGAFLLNSRGKVTSATFPESVSTEVMKLHLLVGNYLAHPTMTCRREALLKQGGYRNVVIEDYDLWLRAAADGQSLAKWAGPVIGYRRHATQITRTWDIVEGVSNLEPAYSALLPDRLRSLAPVLARSAVLRSRQSSEELVAFEFLASWIRSHIGILNRRDQLTISLLLRRVTSTSRSA